jgi:hypothetical protein
MPVGSKAMQACIELLGQPNQSDSCNSRRKYADMQFVAKRWLLEQNLSRRQKEKHEVRTVFLR